jgi:hypothetical protein
MSAFENFERKSADSSGRFEHRARRFNFGMNPKSRPKQIYSGMVEICAQLGAIARSRDVAHGNFCTARNGPDVDRRRRG